ncbi:MAG: type I restriction-modification system subunit M [Deltaproteobacteria bacterium]|nr:type I restriction-modification system subunit M [Deltaproteobacteria bacterium]
MAIKKSELYSSLWKSCDELRGGMDASQYKDYVLVLLFVKYVSDKYAGKKYASIVIPEGGSFKDMVALKGKKDIGEGINTIIAKLAEANNLKGVIDVADFDNSDKLGKGKEMVDRLSNLVGIFQNESFDFSKNKAEGDDILGDAYEYLMRHFATESGKSKGQFYTPAEVSRIIAKVIGISHAKSQEQTIYDPTCGSGSLLLKADDETHQGVTIYGQERDNATAALAKMNMILHGNPTAEIWQDNTLSNPYFKNLDGTLKTFDFAVANPPFSDKAWSNGFDPLNDLYERFKGYGVPPAKNGDYAFLLHLVRSLKSKGKGAIILPHGVLFRGNAEAEIRKNIIRRGFIKGIIGLPANLFYGTGIPACIIVIDKENADNRKGIFMIDAGKGFVKDGNKNRLREQDIHKIVDVFNKQTEVPKYSRMVSVEEIERNEYNLNIPRYIDSQEAEDIQDIEAHLLGDIPKQDIDDLDNYWQVYPTLKDALFTTNSREGYVTLTIPQEYIKHTIFSHPEFADYAWEIDTAFKTWKDEWIPMLKILDVDARPKEVIHNLSESILASFADKDLIDQYDIYQHLMIYWMETMQDDVYLIAADGWKAELSRVNGKKDEWDSELVPKQLVINRYFANDKKAIEQLEADRDDISRQMEETEEEHSGEEGLLEEVKSDKGKISKGNVQKRIKVIKNDAVADDFEELNVLEAYLRLIDKEAKAKKQIKDARKALENKVIDRYKVFTEDEIKTLVVDDKWMAAISGDVRSEMERISQRLARRIKELAKRYDSPMPAMNAQVDELEMKVNGHLEIMGFDF